MPIGTQIMGIGTQIMGINTQNMHIGTRARYLLFLIELALCLIYKGFLVSIFWNIYKDNASIVIKEMEKVYMSPEELALYFRSKKDFYKFLRYDRKVSISDLLCRTIVLPTYRNWKLEFMRQLLRGEKEVFFVMFCNYCRL